MTSECACTSASSTPLLRAFSRCSAGARLFAAPAAIAAAPRQPLRPQARSVPAAAALLLLLLLLLLHGRERAVFPLLLLPARRSCSPTFRVRMRTAPRSP